MGDYLARKRPEAVERETPLSRLFDNCGPDEARQLYTPERRSVRIHGHSTTVRLERAFWDRLEQIAWEERLSVAELINRVHDHCQAANEKNLSSCLRVICLKYHQSGPVDLPGD